MLYEKTSSQIIQAAAARKQFRQKLWKGYKVHNTLGFGFLEGVFEKSMMIECKKRNLSVQNQVNIDVFYENLNVGHYLADIIVDKKIILELKAVAQINSFYHAQLLHYLKSTKYKLGILLNFGRVDLAHRTSMHEAPLQTVREVFPHTAFLHSSSQAFSFSTYFPGFVKPYFSTHLLNVFLQKRYLYFWLLRLRYLNKRSLRNSLKFLVVEYR